MPEERMTLTERLRNPAWVHSHVSVMAAADLDKDQTVADLDAAASEIERLLAAERMAFTAGYWAWRERKVPEFAEAQREEEAAWRAYQEGVALGNGEQ